MLKYWQKCKQKWQIILNKNNFVMAENDDFYTNYVLLSKYLNI